MEQKIRLPNSIESRIDSYMQGRVYSTEIATTLNSILYDEFSKSNMKPTFSGEYFIDYQNPDLIRVYCHQGTEACSPIESKRKGVIWRAIKTGQDQYVPDVTKDTEHIGCDPNMQGSELVLLSWSNPYEEIRFAGHSIPLGVLDIDLNIKDALIIKDIERLRKIWNKYGKLVFPGSPIFFPGNNIKIAQYEPGPKEHILNYSGKQFRSAS